MVSIRVPAVGLCTILVSACPPNPGSLVTVPITDSTPPTTLMDAHFTEPGKGYVTVSNNSPPVTVQVRGNEEVSLVAKGEDIDGGCQDVQIWVESTTWRNSGGIQSQTGPGLLGSPTASAPDTISKPGDQARKTCLLTHKLNVAQLRGGADRMRLRIWAEAVNFHGTRVSSAPLTLEWP